MACDRKPDRIRIMPSRSVYRTVVTSYVASLAFWLALRVLLMDRFWLVALLNTMAVYLFAPLPPLLLLAFTLRQKQSLGLLTLPILTFAGLYGELLIPQIRAPDRIDGASIEVMTFNIDYRNDDIGSVAEAIRSAGPGVVGLQEISAEQSRALSVLLGDEYPYRTPTVLAENRRIGLFSRYPIHSWVELWFPPRQQVMRAELDIDGDAVYVYVAHFSPTIISKVLNHQGPTYVTETYAWRADEAANLAASVSSLSKPVIVLCDCNFTDTSSAYSVVEAVLVDSFREAGWGFGHTIKPAGIPFHLQRIDFIWHSADFVALEASTGPDAGSDHRPVSATLVLKRRLPVDP